MARISEVVNNKDGHTVTVRLAEPHTDALAFSACRMPEAVLPYLSTEFYSAATVLDHSVDYTEDGNGGYVLTLVGAEEDHGTRWPFYVRVRDGDDGEWSDYAPVFVCYGTDDDLLTEVTKAVADILAAYKPLLNLRLANASPIDAPTKVQAILSGFAYNAERFPVIDVTAAQWTEDIWQIGAMTVVGKVAANISCYAFHASSVAWRPLINALGFAVRDVLNQDHLLEIALPSGLTLTKCFVSSVEIAELQEGDKFFTVATLRWEAEVQVPFV